jgi:hypothetical protein
MFREVYIVIIPAGALGRGEEPPGFTLKCSRNRVWTILDSPPIIYESIENKYRLPPAPINIYIYAFYFI